MSSFTKSESASFNSSVRRKKRIAGGGSKPRNESSGEEDDIEILPDGTRKFPTFIKRVQIRKKLPRPTLDPLVHLRVVDAVKVREQQACEREKFKRTWKRRKTEAEHEAYVLRKLYGNWELSAHSGLTRAQKLRRKQEIQAYLMEREEAAERLLQSRFMREKPPSDSDEDDDLSPSLQQSTRGRSPRTLSPIGHPADGSLSPKKLRVSEILGKVRKKRERTFMRKRAPTGAAVGEQDSPRSSLRGSPTAMDAAAMSSMRQGSLLFGEAASPTAAFSPSAAASLQPNNNETNFGHSSVPKLPPVQLPRGAGKNGGPSLATAGSFERF